MELREAVKACGSIYHVTTLDRWERIKNEGLLPSSESYQQTDFKDKPLICLSIPAKKTKWIKEIMEKGSEGKAVLLRISAETVASLNISLDETSSELQFKMEKLRTSDVKILLHDIGMPGRSESCPSPACGLFLPSLPLPKVHRAISFVPPTKKLPQDLDDPLEDGDDYIDRAFRHEFSDSKRGGRL